MPEPKQEFRVRLVLDIREPDTNLVWREWRTSRAFDLHKNPANVFDILEQDLNREMSLIYALANLEREA